jgi:hypothetical protein
MKVETKTTVEFAPNEMILLVDGYNCVLLRHQDYTGSTGLDEELRQLWKLYAKIGTTIDTGCNGWGMVDGCASVWFVATRRMPLMNVLAWLNLIGKHPANGIYAVDWVQRKLVEVPQCK